MSEPLYFVVIRAVRQRTGRPRKRMIIKKVGPVSWGEANAMCLKMWVHNNPKNYSISVELDRTAYFAKRHKNLYGKNAAYRERKRANALDWQRKARAAAKGDVTPWLTQD